MSKSTKSPPSFNSVAASDNEDYSRNNAVHRRNGHFESNVNSGSNHNNNHNNSSSSSNNKNSSTEYEHGKLNSSNRNADNDHASDDDEKLDKIASTVATNSATPTHSILSVISTATAFLTQQLDSKKCSGKKIISFVLVVLILAIAYDSLVRDANHRLISTPDFAERFLFWVQAHPSTGVLAFLLVIAIGVITMIPIGTPLTIGCGYIYKGAYGWKLGVALATLISMGGSAIGAVTCFLLGRYLMRDQVRQWIRKYPLFDAIDAAAAEHGLRIMAMLYLTPILPLGPVSYMCGTTSMALSNFVMAKIASLPLMLLYVFIGASTGALLTNTPATATDRANMSAAIGSDGQPVADNASHKMSEQMQDIEGNNQLIVAGIVMSMIMITGITHYIKKELNRIIERQKKSEGEPSASLVTSHVDDDEPVIELGGASNTVARQRRQAN